MILTLSCSIFGLELKFSGAQSNNRIMNFIITLLSPTLAKPMIEPHISSLHKRDDYSFEYFTDEPKINLQSTDPDINPLFLSFLLSLIVLGNVIFTHI